MSTHPWLRMFGVAVAAGVSVVACQSPLDSEETDAAFRARINEAVTREITNLPPNQGSRWTQMQPSGIEDQLASRREELDELTPQWDDEVEADLGLDLTGKTPTQVSIALQPAISAAVGNNLGVQQARLQPAISAADVVTAEAAFDAVLFGSATLTQTDQPSPVAVIGGVPLGVGASVADSRRFETGVRSRLESGGEVSISTDLQRTDDQSPGPISLTPDPAYASSVRVGIDQPLLRGFGSDVNTATIRLSRNVERRSVQDLKAALLETVAQTEQAYWDLQVAWASLVINEWLRDVGIEVRDVLKVRYEVFDANQAEYADAVARVEQRRADVIRSRRAVQQASDQLKVIINDPDLSVGSESLLRPSDTLHQEPIEFSLRDSIVTAIDNRPEIQKAILNIDDASIRELVADNQRLPMLNLHAEAAYYGLDDDGDGAYSELGESRFIEYIMGAIFEVPIGNRAAESQFRRARLERAGAVIGYQQALQSVVADVKSALQDVVTNYELIQATKDSRLAAAENLRALLVQEEMLSGLTPEFLNLKFQRQDQLASARRQEVEALASYDASLAQLHRAMGVGLTMNQIKIELVDNELPADGSG